MRHDSTLYLARTVKPSAKCSKGFQKSWVVVTLDGVEWLDSWQSLCPALMKL